MYPDNLTRTEALARSAHLRTHGYTIEVDLTGAGLEESDTFFRSTSTVTFQALSSAPLHIDLIAERVVSASLDGGPIDPAMFASSRLPFAVEPGEHELSVEAIFRYSHSGDGLHRFVDPADQRVYLYTQFEPADARRVYACFEQPDLKARFSIRVLAPAEWTVVSNGVELERESHGDAVRHIFAETLPISTYLTAIVAGDYHVARSSHTTVAGELPLSVLCRRSLADHLDADRIFAVTTDGFATFERHFDFPYPFGKYDQVFVPEYNSGAMENVGCIVLRDEYVFRSRQTAATYQARTNTILHELSHMWFGDLVTMKWWDDLWLKESFATWAASFAVSETAADPSAAWATFCNGSKNWAYRQDQLPSTHPIAADMVDLEAVELNFDGITYAKGASVLVQLVAFVGRDAFLAGLRGYFRDHAYGNTSLTDLLGALERSSGRDLSRWSGEWLETAGVNTLAADLEVAEDGSFSSFVVTQTASDRWPTLRSHRAAVGLYQLSGDTLARVGRVETDVSGASTPVPELVGLRQPDLVLPNDDDLTYAKIRLDSRSLATAVEHIDKVTSPLTRALLWGASWDMCRDAELAAVDYIGLVLRGIGRESDLTAVRYLLNQAQSAANSYAPVGVRGWLLRAWQEGVADLLDAATPSSDHQLAFARSFAVAAEDDWAADRLTGWLRGSGVPDGLSIDPELRWLIVQNLSRLGRLGDVEISRELQRDNTITGAEQAAAARAAQPTAAAKAMAWDQAVHSESVPNGTHTAITLAFWQRGQDDVLESFVQPYLETVEAISRSSGTWGTRGTALRNNVLRYLFPWPADKRPFLERLDGWLAGTELIASVQRIVDERRDDLVRALNCQATGSARHGEQALIAAGRGGTA